MLNKKTTRTLVITLILVLLVAAFAGCTTDAGKDQPADKPNADAPKQEATGDSTENEKFEGTLKVQMIGGWKSEDSTDPQSGRKILGLHVLKEEFERLYPNATVEFVIMGWDNYNEKTQAMMTGNECDIYQVPGIANLVAQDLVEPLAPYIEKDNYDLGKFIPGQIEGWQAMGSMDTELTTYGVPVLGDCRILVYDKQIFDDWGVDYLSEEPTLEEIIEAAKKMTGTNPVTGEENYGVAWRGKTYSADTAINFCEYYGGKWGENFKFEDMETYFDSPEMIKAVQTLYDLQEYAPEGMAANQGAEKWLTAENNIAIHLYVGPGFWMTAKELELGDRYQASLLFVNPDTGMGGMFAGSPYVIGKTSENKELAWEFLKFFTDDFAQEYLFVEHKQMPVINSAAEWESIKNEPQMPVVMKALARAWAPRYPYRSAQPRYIFGSAVERALLGEVTVEVAMQDCQKEVEEWLKQYK